jgi:hypothetical protein
MILVWFWFRSSLDNLAARVRELLNHHTRRIATIEPMNWNFQSTADSLGSMHQLDGAIELIGYQITNHAGAVS